MATRQLGFGMIIETQFIWENKIDGNQTTNQINIFEKLKAKFQRLMAKDWC